jgi:hypothetical protein
MSAGDELVLDVKCSECGGAGAIQSPAWADYWAARDRGEIPAENPDEPEELICGVCYGRQRIPTELGERILEFVRRHGWPLVVPGDPLADELAIRRIVTPLDQDD